MVTFHSSTHLNCSEHPYHQEIEDTKSRKQEVLYLWSAAEELELDQYVSESKK